MSGKAHLGVLAAHHSVSTRPARAHAECKMDQRNIEIHGDNTSPQGSDLKQIPEK